MLLLLLVFEVIRSVRPLRWLAYKGDLTLALRKTKSDSLTFVLDYRCTDLITFLFWTFILIFVVILWTNWMPYRYVVLH